jgi:hypothetical protein
METRPKNSITAFVVVALCGVLMGVVVTLAKEVYTARPAMTILQASTATPAPAPASVTPEAIATAAPTPTAQVVTATAKVDQPGTTISPGDQFLVPAGFTCSGDIQVKLADNSWQSLFDNDETSGLVTTFKTVATIRAPWGAYCDPDDKPSLMKTRLEAAGCVNGNGCKTVTVITWPK